MVGDGEGAVEPGFHVGVYAVAIACGGCCGFVEVAWVGGDEAKAEECEDFEVVLWCDGGDEVVVFGDFSVDGFGFLGGADADGDVEFEPYPAGTSLGEECAHGVLEGLVGGVWVCGVGCEVVPGITDGDAHEFWVERGGGGGLGGFIRRCSGEEEDADDE